MIDRAARNQGALLVRRLASGRISPDEFGEVDFIDWNGKDLVSQALNTYAIQQTYKQMLHFRLARNRRRERQEWRKLAHWVLFLHSDCEYRYPVDLGDCSPFLITAFVTLMLFLMPPDNHMFEKVLETIALWTVWGLFEKWRARGIDRVGDKSVWPFFHAHELKQARLFPRLLGKQAG